MKTLRVITNSKGLQASVLKSVLSLLAIAGLAVGFWTASAPLAHAARVTPAEMLQSSMPGKMTLADAPKADVLSAVCKAVTKYKDDAPQIVRTAAGARKDLSADIVTQAVRCSHDEKGADCEVVRRILHAGTDADPENAARLTETVVALAPDCGLDTPAEGPGNFGTTVNNINPPPGSSGGGGTQNSCQVCHNGHQITVACDNLQTFLRGHPGDTAGACETTPSTNQ
jgi:hypothetical protein